MAEIKTREKVKDIKALDKASVAGERMKQAFIRSMDTAQNLMDDGEVSPSEYAEDKVKYAAEDVAHDTGHVIKKQTDKAVEKGREAFREHREEKRLERQEQRTEEAIHRYEQAQQSTETTWTGAQGPVYRHEQASRQTGTDAASQARRSARRKDRTIKTAERSEHTIKQTARSTGKATVKSHHVVYPCQSHGSG